MMVQVNQVSVDACLKNDNNKFRTIADHDEKTPVVEDYMVNKLHGFLNNEKKLLTTVVKVILTIDNIFYTLLGYSSDAHFQPYLSSDEYVTPSTKGDSDSERNLPALVAFIFICPFI